MTDAPITLLPIAYRLALSYAPAKARENILSLLLLDNRLASILRNRGETIIAQMKLAWWRDRLGENPQNWPAGEPLLQRLREWEAEPHQLLGMVNGWEALLADRLDKSALHEFAAGRAMAWQALAKPGKGEVAAKIAHQWALADLSIHLDNADEAEMARSMALEAAPSKTQKLARNLRPLAVLHGLTMRAMKRGSGELLDGPAAGFLALRIGLAGR